MDTINEIVYHCDKVIRLMRTEKEELHECLEGDLLGLYQQMVDTVINNVQKIRGELLRIDV